MVWGIWGKNVGAGQHCLHGPRELGQKFSRGQHDLGNLGQKCWPGPTSFTWALWVRRFFGENTCLEIFRGQHVFGNLAGVEPCFAFTLLSLLCFAFSEEIGPTLLCFALLRDFGNSTLLCFALLRDFENPTLLCFALLLDFENSTLLCFALLCLRLREFFHEYYQFWEI